MYKYKQFNELEQAIEWLNDLKYVGDFIYEVESIYSTPEGVFVVLYGEGQGWGDV